MKYAIRIIALLICVQAGALQADGIKFFEGRFAALKAQALLQQKPFMVNFFTDWCGPCDNMDKYTFADKELGTYAEENYLAFSVNAESAENEGVQLAQRYDVLFFPTILIFSPEGKLMHKLSGYQRASTLLVELKKYRYGNKEAKAESKPVAAAAKPATIPQPEKPVAKKETVQETSEAQTKLVAQSTRNMEPIPPANPPSSVAEKKPEPVEEEVEMKAKEAAVKPAPKPVPVKKAAPKSAFKGQGLFSIDIKQQSKEGYGVQVGVYVDYANAIKESQKLAAEGHENLLMGITELIGKPGFKLMLGPYSTASDADAKLKEIQNKGRVGLVIPLADY
ncbi:MAG: thioredoxin fold domain-containing protein [Bacteroidota bacterium]